MEINKIVKKYKEIYRYIFENIYPSKNSTGFTERNLSVNFAKAYERFYPNAITWYEFQFGENNNLHYDAIIINPENREIVVIESKRFSELFKKVREVGEDIERIRDFDTKYFAEFANRIPYLEEYSIVGVILADIWTEGKNKKAVMQTFKESSFVQHYQKYFSQDIKNQAAWFSNGQYFCEDFADVKPSHVKDNVYIRETYYLLGMIWDDKRK